MVSDPIRAAVTAACLIMLFNDRDEAGYLLSLSLESDPDLPSAVMILGGKIVYSPQKVKAMTVDELKSALMRLMG
ncbi:hypothetical protein [Rhizobium hainanense]|uniref:Uncharacterized protein n=1 Tax=Rhizobium hainanense TaxID=52131 RepID=A0A1C3WDB5_9HYPH|nr:hypothetical protein [Rhizobium hainanense]SCB37684.1 hypothetical protein GA0061100_11571 [Rhizobium hainanense]